MKPNCAGLQLWHTLPGLQVDDEAWEEVLAANLDLRKKSHGACLVGSEIERQVWSTERIDW